MKLKLEHRISILVIVIVVVTVALSVAAAGYWNITQMEEELGRNAYNLVTVTALSPIVVDGLTSPQTHGQLIQPFVEKTQAAAHDIEVMVVADKDGLRYGHTMSDRVGLPFSAEDHDRALVNGETYVTIGPGTLGQSLRAFAPVVADNGEIIGFVMAGSLMDSVERAKRDNMLIMGGFILLGILLGTMGAIYVARKIRKSLLGYEPEDIARLYLENQGILETVHEGIIAIDRSYRITLVNNQTKALLHLDDDVVGQSILDVFPRSKLAEAMDAGEPLLDVQYALGDVIVLSSNIPLRDGDEIVGGVASFRDQTDMNRLAEEMTGVKRIVDSLRATTHEFKNKLHVILGFLEMGHADRAKAYIADVDARMQNAVGQVIDLVKEPTVAALIIGKMNRASELRIELDLDQSAPFSNAAAIDPNSLVVAIGNLLDNALEHLDTVAREDKRIALTLGEEGDEVRIVVRDNGDGVPDMDALFDKGFSTKAGSRGYGLPLVRETAEKYLGSVLVQSGAGGSVFTVTMRKRERSPA